MKKGATRRLRLPFRLGNLGTRSFRKFMRKIGQRGGQLAPTAAGTSVMPGTSAMPPAGMPGTSAMPAIPAAAVIPGTSGMPAATTGVIKIPAGKKGTGFDFSNAVSSLPATFGTLDMKLSSSSTTTLSSDPSEFTINLASKYSRANMPAFFITGYIYTAPPNRSARYLNVQRQFGVQTGTAAAEISIDSAVKKMNIKYLLKAGNFPYTGNDGDGYALYIIFQIFN
jgi:hypothetical protein